MRLIALTALLFVVTPAFAAEPTAAVLAAPKVEATTARGSWTPAIVSWSIGAVALGTGIVLGLRATRYHDRATDPELAGAQTQIAPGKASQLGANISLGVSAVAIVVGFATRIMGDRPAKVVVAPISGGAAVVSSLTF